jgi:hypothetical protein
MTNDKTNESIVGTSRGRAVTEADIADMVSEAEVGYDVATLRPGIGRPPMGLDPAEVVLVDAKAAADGITAGEVIREALRRFLHVE